MFPPNGREKLEPIMKKPSRKTILKKKPSKNLPIDKTAAINEIMLFKSAKRGNQAAKTELLSKYYGWATNIARKYHSLFPNIDVSELEAEGNRGLLEAVDRFDPSKKVKFSTYAWYWILKDVQEYISSSINLIGVPAKIVADLRKVVAAMNDNLKNGKEPELDKISKKLGFALEDVNAMLSSKKNVSSPLSLDMYLNDEDKDDTLSDMVEDNKLEGIKKFLDSIDDKKSILEFFKHLTPLEQKVLSLRFGFKDGETHSLNVVGKLLKIPPVKVKDIESIALMKLKRYVSTITEE
jgi:RNA polymerase sigma factor (sigma-70 family)